LYKQPILEELSEYFIEKYVDPKDTSQQFMKKIMQTIPRKGAFDIDCVRDSQYFFS